MGKTQIFALIVDHLLKIKSLIQLKLFSKNIHDELDLSLANSLELLPKLTDN
jgi:hypothetical protein